MRISGRPASTDLIRKKGSILSVVQDIYDNKSGVEFTAPFERMLTM